MADPKPPARKSSLGKDKCSRCSKMVGVKDDGIQCEICQTWFHPKCVDVSSDLYGYLQKCTNIHWYCDTCNKGIGQVVEELSKVKNRQENTEIMMQKINHEIERLNNRSTDEFNKIRTDLDKHISMLTTKVEDIGKKKTDNVIEFREIVKQQMEEDMQARVDNTVKRELTSQVGEVQQTIIEGKEIAKSFREEKAEQEDIESRRCNVILYRIPESDEVLAEDRNKHDKSVCEQFFHAFNVGFDRDDIRRVQRLGKRNDNYPRPILVQLGSRHIKNMIMESLYKIKSMDARLRNVIVAHNLTKKQREECKALVEEAKAKTEQESGDFIYRVRGPPGLMRMVKVRKTN